MALLFSTNVRQLPELGHIELKGKEARHWLVMMTWIVWTVLMKEMQTRMKIYHSLLEGEEEEGVVPEARVLPLEEEDREEGAVSIVCIFLNVTKLLGKRKAS